MSGVASLVDGATSDLLIGPDWGRNLELCDAVNNDPGQAKDVAKAIKKRLANKNPTIQLLTLTVLETLMKNCGDALHYQVADKDILHEMVKIVKKRGDFAVRDKVLALLDSWQEAFGGQRGRYPQFFLAYDELRRSGVDFPQRQDAVPIFTPPQTHPITAFPAAQEFASAPEPHLPLDVDIQRLSLADLDSARSGMEILSEMLNAVDPRDKSALRQELIVELVEQCQHAQKQVMQLVNTTSDETLLFQALSLNDDLQKVLSKRDAIASGAHPPRDEAVVFTHPDEEGEDDFAQLAHRSRQNSDQSAPKPKPPTQPQLVRIPGPPGQSTKTPPPGKTSPGVDLLSGEVLGAGASKKAEHRLEESEENVNPFALQKQPPSPASSGKPTSSTYQQEKPTSLPPPPIKHSQRQQFFQQQHHHDQKMPADQEHDQQQMENPYAALFRQEPKHSNTSSLQNTYQRQEQGQKPPNMNDSSNNNNTSSLFSDLVDFQSARMKRGG